MIKAIIFFLVFYPSLALAADLSINLVIDGHEVGEPLVFVIPTSEIPVPPAPEMVDPADFTLNHDTVIYIYAESPKPKNPLAKAIYFLKVAAGK